METSKTNVTLGHRRHKIKDSLRKEKKKTKLPLNISRATVAYFKRCPSIYVRSRTTNKRDSRISSVRIKNIKQSIFKPRIWATKLTVFPLSALASCRKGRPFYFLGLALSCSSCCLCNTQYTATQGQLPSTSFLIHHSLTIQHFDAV
jgi:hypothetical protein